MKTNKSRTWTFEPDNDVRSLMAKAINRQAGRDGNKRGVRTRLINTAIRQQCAALIGKREGDQAQSADLQISTGHGQSVGQSTAK